MRPHHSFWVHISKLRRIILKRSIRRCLVLTFSLSLILITIALGIEKTGFFQWDGYSIYPLLVLIALASSVLSALREKKAFLEELVAIDLRLDLKERLSTAYEYSQLGRRSLFVDLLIKDATHVLGLIKESRIFPRQFSPAYLLIPVFTTALIFFLTVDFPPTVLKQDQSRERLKQIGTTIEQYAKQEMYGGKKTDERFPKDLYQKMDEIAQELKKQSTAKEKLLKSLGELRKEAKTNRIQLAQKLQNELSSGDPSNTPMLNPLKKGNLTPDELKQIKEQLKRSFGGEVPASLSQEISDLTQSLRLEQFVGKTEDQVKSALKEKDDFLLLEEKKQAFKREGKEETAKAPLSGRVLAFLPQGRETDEGRAYPTPGKASSDSDREEERGTVSVEDQAVTAGKNKSAGEKRSPYELKGSKRPAVQDKGGSGPGEWYNVHVRSLPTIAKAKMKEEKIIRPYRQEVENVLKKEDIPLHYREYIKNYFLAIGLGKEEDDHGRTQ